MVDTLPVFKSSMWNRPAVTAFGISVGLWLVTAVITAVCVANYNFVSWLWLVVTAGFFGLFSVAPVVLGHLAVLNSRRDLRGRGLGITGLVLGYGGLATGMVGLIILMMLALHVAGVALSHVDFGCSPNCSW